MADFTWVYCSAGRTPSFRASLWRSKLASPFTLTAECLGSHRGLPMSISPRAPRNCEVRVATITSERAAPSPGYARTRTGRLFSTNPSSANQTSPGCGSVRTERIVPRACLFFRSQSASRMSADGKWQRLAKFNLGQEQVKCFAGLQSEPGQDFLGVLETLRGHTGSEKYRGPIHVQKCSKRSALSTTRRSGTRSHLRVVGGSGGLPNEAQASQPASRR